MRPIAHRRHFRALGRAMLPLFFMAALAPSAQAAQWKWRDASGVVQYSDQPPPGTIPARDILQRPGANGSVAQAPSPQSASQPRAGDATQQQAASELDKKIAEKKKADQAAQEQAKLQQQQAQTLQNQQNCLQAQKQLLVVDSGQRMVQIDAQGQRAIMDDAQRAAERARIAGLMSQYCR
ncbi:DUF4124 domain-containing protein [Thiomonas intermedia]|uniref:DUF4124 domain-containing protein n=1 Tax=Thiomonas intermedia TaxID=926 RepID=UPI001FE6A40C|nr:DUF4124 domain-containing protein [Thiomonas intermedia]